MTNNTGIGNAAFSRRKFQEYIILTITRTKRSSLKPKTYFLD